MNIAPISRVGRAQIITGWAGTGVEGRCTVVSRAGGIKSESAPEDLRAIETVGLARTEIRGIPAGCDAADHRVRGIAVHDQGLLFASSKYRPLDDILIGHAGPGVVSGWG